MCNIRSCTALPRRSWVSRNRVVFITSVVLMESRIVTIRLCSQFHSIGMDCADDAASFGLQHSCRDSMSDMLLADVLLSVAGIPSDPLLDQWLFLFGNSEKRFAVSLWLSCLVGYTN